VVDTVLVLVPAITSRGYPVKYFDAIKVREFLQHHAEQHGETPDVRQCIEIVDREIDILKERSERKQRNFARATAPEL